MAGPKTADNQQWGLVSPDGTRVGAGAAALPAGDGGEPLIDPNSRVWTVGAPAPFPFAGFTTRQQFFSPTAVETRDVLSVPGMFEQIGGFVDHSARVFAQMYDMAAGPPTTENPFLSIPVEPGFNTFGYTWPSGWELSNGLVLCFSSAALTFVSVGTVGYFNATLWSA